VSLLQIYSFGNSLKIQFTISVLISVSAQSTKEQPFLKHFPKADKSHTTG